MNLNALKVMALGAKNHAAAALRAGMPGALIIGGIVLTGVAGFLAAKAARKADAVMENAKRDFQLAKDIRNSVAKAKSGEEEPITYEDGTPITEKDSRKITAAAFGRTIFRYGKLFGPSVIVFAVGAISILYGAGTLRKWYKGAMASAAGLTATIHEYRERVKNEIGAEREELLYRCGKRIPISMPTIDPETGEVHDETAIRSVIDENATMSDPDCALWDEATTAEHNIWTKTPGLNLRFLLSMEQRATDRLIKKGPGGWLTLNEVREMIGLESTLKGINRGWVYGPGNQNKVSFGLMEAVKRNGNEDDPGCFTGGIPSYWLHFNCDGEIPDILSKMREERLAASRNARKERRHRKSERTA